MDLAASVQAVTEEILLHIADQLHNIEPWAYLRDVLTLLPTWPNRDVLQLAPKFWDHTRQQPQTQQRLAAARLLDRFDQEHV
jgi:hypothetical protein